MKALITGIAGQDGSYLAEYLVGLGHEVHGLLRPATNRDLGNLDDVRDSLTLWPGDVTDSVSVDHVVEQVRPDQVYNLAAVSYVPDSWRAPSLAFEVNAHGLLNVLGAVARFNQEAHIYQASTSEIFGDAGGQTQVNETSPMTPTSPYGVSKLAAHRLAALYRRAYGLFICSGILFNHESPRRAPTFLSRKVASAFARYALALPVSLTLGNLTVRRDWGYAPEYVRSMYLMLTHPEPADYVVATGVATSVDQFVRYMAHEAAQISGMQPDNFLKAIGHDDSPPRLLEVPNISGDSRLARSVLGWLPQTDVRSLARIMVASEIDRLEAEQ